MLSRRAAVSLTLAGLAAAAARRAGAQAAPVAIRVAGIPIDAGACAYYASEQGFFKKHGLDATVSTGANGAAIAAAVIGGSLDIGNGNTVVLAQAHERGVPFVYVAPSGMYRGKEPTGGMLVTKSSPLKTASDLIGKTLGVATLGAIGDLSARAWLDKNGVPSSEMKYVEVPYSAMGAALVAGRIDAAVAEEPFVSGMLANDARMFAHTFDALGPQFNEGGYFCTLAYATANPDVVRRFADAMAETNDWADTHRDETLQILDKYAKAPFPANMARMWYPERLHVADFQPLIDAAAKYGLLKAAFPAREMFAPGLGG